jgi:hypothetical protein
MLDYPTLAKKPKVTIYKDGEKYEMIDLLSKIYNGDTNIYGNTFTITKEYIARPDLVSYAVYGSDRFGDLICKVNGISNPFELNEGMIIFAPLREFLDKITCRLGASNELVSPNSKINSNGTNDNIFSDFSTSMLDNSKLKEEIKKDPKKNKTISSTIGKEFKTSKKLKNERRSPGEQTIEDVNYVIDKSLGLVYY